MEINYLALILLPSNFVPKIKIEECNKEYPLQIDIKLIKLLQKYEVLSQIENTY